MANPNDDAEVALLAAARRKADADALIRDARRDIHQTERKREYMTAAVVGAAVVATLGLAFVVQ